MGGVGIDETIRNERKGGAETIRIIRGMVYKTAGSGRMMVDIIARSMEDGCKKHVVAIYMFK